MLDIDEKNWEQCASLEVFDYQKKFIASNLYSIAESKYENRYQPIGIYYNEKLIGFCMLGKEEKSDTYWIIRFMIDKNYQGRGLGRKALLAITKYLSSTCKYIIISYNPKNEIAKKLYNSIGFIENGEIIQGEAIAVFEI